MSRAARDARRRVVTPRRAQREFCDHAWLFALLDMSAPQIEAAGSVDRAIECGLMGGFGAAGEFMVEGLRMVLPVHRGGVLRDHEREWDQLVSDIVRDRDVDMVKLRQLVAEYYAGAK